MLTLEDTDLELFLHEEAGCEGEHVETACSVRVTHRVSSECDGDSFLVCLIAAAITVKRMRDPGSGCSRCGRDCSECWTIRPA